MNLKEGTRRLALLLGTAGAVLGGFASYTVLSDAWGARARYKEFGSMHFTHKLRFYFVLPWLSSMELRSSLGVNTVESLAHRSTPPNT